MTGVAPIWATIYELERWRCNLCEEEFTAPVSAGVGEEKFDASVPALIGERRHGTGVPHHRIERLQLAFGIPLPVSTQWEWVLAAAGLLLHNDDTPIGILKRVLPVQKKGRKAVQTTAILSHVGEHRIALYLTGMKHAGENLEAVLKLRAEGLDRPIQMSDALAANHAGDEGGPDTLVSHCLVHARRRFVEIEAKFPRQVRIVLRFLSLIYRIDARTRIRGMDPEARLAYHQRRSQPLMEKLETWLKQQIEGKLVEPNSTLGDALDYMKNHWQELTLFLREPGAPLDNSACERVIKRAIMHRKNSLFYRTQVGAGGRAHGGERPAAGGRRRPGGAPDAGSLPVQPAPHAHRQRRAAAAHPRGPVPGRRPHAGPVIGGAIRGRSGLGPAIHPACGHPSSAGQPSDPGPAAAGGGPGQYPDGGAALALKGGEETLSGQSQNEGAAAGSSAESIPWHRALWTVRLPAPSRFTVQMVS